MPDESLTGIYEPVKLYKNRFKGEFAQKARDLYEKFVETAGIDEAANAMLVAEIHDLEKKISRLQFFRGFLRLVRNALAAIAVLYIAYRILVCMESCRKWSDVTKDTVGNILIPIAILIGFAALIILVALGIQWLSGKITEAEALLKNKIREAWDMMWPLNRQFQWETMNNLIMEVVPVLKIDRIFNRARFAQLYNDYGLEDFGEKCSVSCCQSGTFNGNPFILADVINQDWTLITYSGSRVISYQVLEYYTDSNGNRRSRWVTKYETLTAYKKEWAPAYFHDKMLIYGHDAAPDLKFSREPMGIAGNERKMRKTIKELEEKNRDLEQNFTMMQNQEFDASFYAIDRSDERQFQVLYSILSQQETYNLLKDKEEGYGDDFSFEKRNKINILSSYHMGNVDFSSDPWLVRDYDFKKVKEKYFDYSTEYFRNFYFSFAPLFCIQAYHSPAHDYLQNVSKKETGEPLASHCEYEALANYMGEKMFKSGDADTKCILKARPLEESGGVENVAVYAKSFSKVERWAYINVTAGNGSSYEVPVRYYEFIPVTKESIVKVCYTGAPDGMAFADITNGEEWKKIVSGLNVNEETLVFRRGLAAFLASSEKTDN